MSSANALNWTGLKFCCLEKGQPITRRQILDASKLKAFADDNFRFDENGRELSKWVENTEGKGEIARSKQFLLFPVFSKGLFPRGIKRYHCVGMGEAVLSPLMNQSSVIYTDQEEICSKRNEKKRPDADNEHFLHFPVLSLLFQGKIQLLKLQSL